MNNNDALVIRSFASRGIDATPRVDVRTYRAWKQVGRQVRKGETGVKLPVIVETKKDGKPSKYLRSVAVFHVSQTIDVVA